MTYKTYPLFLILGLYKQNRVIIEQNWQFLEKQQVHSAIRPIFVFFLQKRIMTSNKLF